MHFVLEGVLSVQGVALVRHSVASRYVEQGTLVRLFEPVIRSRYSYWLCAPPSHFQRDKVRKFADWITASANDFVKQIPFEIDSQPPSRRS